MYCIKDNNGRYEGNISIYTDEKEWCYSSQIYPMSWNIIKENAENKVLKLRELNALAGYKLNWEVVEFTEQEFMDLYKEHIQKDEKLGRNRVLSDYYNTNIEMRAIQKGCVVKHRKIFMEIYKKYKYIMKQLV